MPKRSGRHSSKTLVSSGDAEPGTVLLPAHRNFAPLGKTLTVQAQSGVETGAEILERHPSGKLNDLGVAELEVQPLRQVIGDLGRHHRGPFGVLEDDPLALVVELALLPTTDVAYLLRVDPRIHAL